MTCEHVRLQIGAEPLANDAAVAVHVAGCADCAQYQREMRTLEANLGRAMQWPASAADAAAGPASAARRGNVVELDAARASRAAAASAAAPAAAMPDAAGARAWRPAPLWFSVAACVALVSGVLTFAFLARPTDAIASALVEHMADEAESWTETRVVPQSALDLVLRRSGVRLDAGGAADVVYAHSCFFRGRYVPHLVVRTAQGPVTVLVLPGEPVQERTSFSEGGYSGVLMPGTALGAAADSSGAPARPSFAILARGALRVDVDDIARRLAPVLSVGNP